MGGGQAQRVAVEREERALASGRVAGGARCPRDVREHDAVLLAAELARVEGAEGVEQAGPAADAARDHRGGPGGDGVVVVGPEDGQDVLAPVVAVEVVGDRLGVGEDVGLGVALVDAVDQHARAPADGGELAADEVGVGLRVVGRVGEDVDEHVGGGQHRRGDVPVEVGAGGPDVEVGGVEQDDPAGQGGLGDVDRGAGGREHLAIAHRGRWRAKGQKQLREEVRARGLRGVDSDEHAAVEAGAPAGGGDLGADEAVEQRGLAGAAAAGDGGDEREVGGQPRQEPRVQGPEPRQVGLAGGHAEGREQPRGPLAEGLEGIVGDVGRHLGGDSPAARVARQGARAESSGVDEARPA